MLVVNLIWYAQKIQATLGCNKSSNAPWGQKYNSNPHRGFEPATAAFEMQHISLVVEATKNGNEVRNSKLCGTNYYTIRRWPKQISR